MTKQEIINAINATIVPNGQKGITAESLNNILNEMVNATPEGGSGGGTEFVEIRADIFGVGLTDEDKAINAAAFAKAASGNDYIYYISLDGLPILSTAGGYYTYEEDDVVIGSLDLFFESAIFITFGLPKLVLSITEDGDAIISPINLDAEGPLDVHDVTNADTLRTALASALTLNDDAYIQGNNIPVCNVPNVPTLGVNSSGVITDIMGNSADIRCFYRHGLTNTLYLLYATNDSFFVCPYENGVITKDSSQDNLNLFSYRNNILKLTTFSFKYSTTEQHSIISANTSNDDYYTFVIYRNGAFENWRVNSDGTTEQITA